MINESGFHRLLGWLPLLSSLKNYGSDVFARDLIAGTITAILLVPQGIAYALLAGMPPQAGLYASILPPLIYALIGTSRVMAVGPVSVAAIMVASALSAPEIQGQGNYLSNALVLALESGLILLTMASLRMGTLVNFISHPVLTGFTGGAAILIIGSQVPALLGLPKFACANSPDFVRCAFRYLGESNLVSAALGFACLILLLLFNGPVPAWLIRIKLSPAWVTAITKTGPLLVVILATLTVSGFALDQDYRVLTVGKVPSGLPQIDFRFLGADTWVLLLPSALFISLVAYVESVAIAKYVANLRRQRIDPNRELIALGLANILASVSSSMPVAGGFSRTMVNFAAGAQTQIASIITAALLAFSVMFFTPWFALIPKTTLAAIILLAIAPLIKFKAMAHILLLDRNDGIAAFATLSGVLLLGIEAGLSLGIVLTLLGYLWRTSRPHIAVVGRVPYTEHFRNVLRHAVETWPHLLLIRVDENLTFANSAFVEDFITAELVRRPKVRHIVLIATAISYVDTTAREMLENLSASLRASGITLHLSEVKGPVMDELERGLLLQQIRPGRVFFRTSEAIEALAEQRPHKKPGPEFTD